MHIGVVAGIALLCSSCSAAARDLEPADHPWILGADDPGVSHWTRGPAPDWNLNSGYKGESFTEVADAAFDAHGDLLIADHRESRIHFVTA